MHTLAGSLRWRIAVATAVLVAACSGGQRTRPVSGAAPAAAWRRWVATEGHDSLDVVARGPDGSTFVIGRDAHAVFVARFTPTGERAWLQPLHGIDDGPRPAIAVDGAGTVVIAGGFTDRLRIGATTLTGRGRKDMFIARLDARGEPLWAERYGGPWFETARAVAVDREGCIYVAGTYQREMDLHGAVIEDGIDNDAFVAKFDARGAHVWNTRLTDSGCLDARGSALALGADGDVYVTGLACRAVTLEGEAAPAADARKVPHAFVARIAQGGAVRWLRTVDASERAEGTDVALAPDGRVVVAGLFEGALSTGDAGRAPSRASDLFVASWGADGARRWVRTLGGPDDEEPAAVAVGGEGEVYLGGARRRSMTCVDTAWDGEGDDAFLARFDRDGTPRAHATLASDAEDVVRDVVLDGDAAVIVGSGGALRFGDEAHTPRGGDDGFVARVPLAALGLAPAAPRASGGFDAPTQPPAARPIAQRPPESTAEVRINFTSEDGSYANQPFVVVAGGVTTEGVTDEHNVAVFRVPVDHPNAELTLPERGFSTTVQVGTLDPIDEPSGQAARLQNLGYVGYFAREHAPVGAAAATELRGEIERFQTDRGLRVTGRADRATCRALRTAHGT